MSASRPADRAPGPLPDGPVAAIDLGSNSFHLLVADLAGGEVRITERRKEKVQLAAGMAPDGTLAGAAVERGLACLERFADRLRGVPPERTRMVGTSALRRAADPERLAAPAQDLLGVPLRVISGEEEGRLVYLGVAHDLGAAPGNRLVIDIGGGSTEIVLGLDFAVERVLSLELGCVVLRERHFGSGPLGEGFLAARAEARAALEPHARALRAAGWSVVAGSSGTIEACEQALIANGWSDADVTREGMDALGRRLAEARLMLLSGVSEDRADIFPAGAAVLCALFDVLGIERLVPSPASLQDGVLFDLLGRRESEDVWARTRRALAVRCGVDPARTARVAGVALDLVERAPAGWLADPARARDLLRWAAELFEIGRSLSPVQYERHSAYLLENGRLRGLGKADRYALVTLVRGHRRGLPRLALGAFPAPEAEFLERICLLFRLAVALCGCRHAPEPPRVHAFRAGDGTLELELAPGTLRSRPALREDLAGEVRLLGRSGWSLSVR